MKEKGVVLRIKKDRDWGDEYIVQWLADGKLDEGKTCWESDPQGAVDTMLAQYSWGKKYGYPVKIADSKYTQSLLGKYGPNYKYWKDLNEIQQSSKEA